MPNELDVRILMQTAHTVFRWRSWRHSHPNEVNSATFNVGVRFAIGPTVPTIPEKELNNKGL